MEKIIEGVFASEKSQKDKLVLLETLKPHILTSNRETICRICCFCSERLTTSDDEIIRKLASFTLLAIFSGFREEVTRHISDSGEITNTEHNKLCRDIVILSLTENSDFDASYGKYLIEMLKEKREIDFTKSDVGMIVDKLPHLKGHFDDSESWMSTWFYYLGKCEPTEDINHKMELEPDLIAKMLSLIGDLLQQGLLSMLQGHLLADIENTDIIQMSCDNFVQSLNQEMLNKCFNNLVNLQIKGVPLSHWILSLIHSLAKSHRYIAIISIVERYTELLLTQTHSDDTIKLLANFLLLHQHSPALFQRHFHKLESARISSSDQGHYIERTMECLMLRFPHFKRTYGSSRIASTSSWVTLYKQLCRSKLRFSAGVGFQNIGNMCYFNSLVQALWLSTPFQHEVIFNKIDSNILSELRRVFLILSYSIKPNFSPDRLYNVLRPPWFDIGSQQDAAELLRHIFDLITSGTASSTPTSLSIQHESNHPHSSQLLGGRDFSITSSKYHRHHGLPKEDNITPQPSAPSQIVTNHFEGKLEINITCGTCSNKSRKDESFLFLTLPIPETEDRLTLTDLIRNVLTPEQMQEENQYHCDRCNLKSNAERTTHIRKTPPLFIFTISRFSYDKVLKCRSKLLKKVAIPEEIVFREEVAADGIRYHPNSTSGRGVKYRLYAVVVHSGYNTESGHYYTYGVPAGNFSNVLANSLCFNDSTVSFISDLDLINNPKSDIDTPYLLFYHSTQLPAPNPSDLDGSLLYSIVNANIEYMQKLERENVGYTSIPPPTSDKRDDNDDNGDFDFYGGCHDSNFAAGSSHYIY